jgi:hypothetical protein
MTGEENEVERRLEVRGDARDRLGLGARHLRQEQLRTLRVDRSVDREERRRGLDEVVRQERPDDEPPDPPSVVLDGQDAVSRSREAGVNDVARLARLVRPDRSHHRGARLASIGSRVHVRAQLLLASRVGEERPVGGVDAHRDPEERVEAAAKLVESVAIDQILDADATVHQKVFRENLGRFGCHAGTLVVWRSRFPPTHADSSDDTSPLRPSWRAAIGSSSPDSTPIILAS